MLNNVRIVIDAGAHIGTFSKAVSLALPQARVLAFEPSKSTFARLKSSVRDFANVEPHNCALGARKCRLSLANSQLEASNSLLSISKKHTDAWPESNTTSVEEVDVRTINEFFPAGKPDSGIFLKADVQGYELEVFRGAEDLLDSITVIQVECSFVTLYEDSPLFSDVVEFLYARGFRIAKIFDLLSPPGSHEAVSCDAVFVRESFLKAR